MRIVYAGTSKEWRGEKINGISHPMSIGKLWSDAELSSVGLARAKEKPPEELSLDEVKASALRKLNMMAASKYREGMADDPTMGIMYREKFDQANSVIGIGREDALALTMDEVKAQYPTLAASIGVHAGDIYACAEIVVGKYEDWVNQTHRIETLRFDYMRQISEAHTEAEVRNILSSATW